MGGAEVSIKISQIAKPLLAFSEVKSMLQTHCFRLTPGQDLKKELIQFCKSQGLWAATLISGVGSLKEAQLRLADAKASSIYQGPFEIVSLIGTLSAEAAHLHIAISDKDGKVLGGHLLDGCLIHTTAEIVLLENTELKFERVQDAATGYKELKIQKR
jgi:predicted DNA-binding protein with PD1-like motif